MAKNYGFRLMNGKRDGASRGVWLLLLDLKHAYTCMPFPQRHKSRYVSIVIGFFFFFGGWDGSMLIGRNWVRGMANENRL